MSFDILLSAFLKFFKKFELLLILLIIGLAYFYNLGKVPFFGDEGAWISFSNRFELFIAGEHDHRVWQPNWVTLSNPTMTYHVIGLFRQMGGWEADMLNKPYTFTKTYQENLLDGRVPNNDLLWWSRAGITSMAVLGIWLLFILLRKHGNLVVAYGWAVIAISNEYLRLHLRRSMNEGVLFGMIMLSIFCLAQALSGWQNRTRAGSAKLLGWLALTGIFIGLAGQTKTNGLAVGAGTILALGLLAVREFESLKRELPRLVGSVVVTGIFATAFFIAPNPTLYQEPIGSTVKILERRLELMNNQARNTNAETFLTIREKFNVGPIILNKHMPLAQTGLNFLFFGLGGGLLLLRMKGWLKKQNNHHMLVAILAGGLLSSLPAFLSLMDWPRYFLLPVIFGTVVILFGLDFLIRICYQKIESFSRTTPN